MPVNYQQIRSQVGEMGRQAPEKYKQALDKLHSALQVFETFGNDPDLIRKRVEAAAEADSGLRCAVPAAEEMLAAFSAPETPPDVVILAADGSQINPSRHEAADFAVINAGALRLAKGSSPKEFTTSRLLYFDSLETASGTLSEELIALMRDVEERQLLADLARGEQAPVVALTDGMLEIFGEPRREAAFQVKFDAYLDSLRALAELNAIVAGYVDKPRADLLVRMLELMAGGEEENPPRARSRVFGGVTDAMILGSRIPPGARSAVFGIQSSSSKAFDGPLRLHFFYLNVGFEGSPVLARVEIPAWVAESGELTGILHAVLIDQCRVTGSKPFPYVLHRAHEIAVVSFTERDQISALIAAELRKQGIEPGEKSFKQDLKDLNGKSRHE